MQYKERAEHVESIVNTITDTEFIKTCKNCGNEINTKNEIYERMEENYWCFPCSEIKFNRNKKD